MLLLLLASGCFWLLVVLCFCLLAGGSWILDSGFCLLPLLKATTPAPATSVPAAASSPSSASSFYFSSLLPIHFF
jgi:hypothetical protein